MYCKVSPKTFLFIQQNYWNLSDRRVMSFGILKTTKLIVLQIDKRAIFSACILEVPSSNFGYEVCSSVLPRQCCICTSLRSISDRVPIPFLANNLHI
jgi:hypothetical protein